jgi:hypothetical protein
VDQHLLPRLQPALVAKCQEAVIAATGMAAATSNDTPAGFETIARSTFATMYSA